MRKAICVVLAAVLSCGMLGTLSGCGTSKANASISEAKATLPTSAGTRGVTEGEAVLTTQAYLLVRSYVEQIEAYDTQSFDAQKYKDLVAQSAEACRVAAAMSASLEKHADALAQAEQNGTAKTQEQAKCEQACASAENATSSHAAQVAYAAEEESAAVKYAQAITKTFDEAKNGQKLKAVAQQYGTDVKKAKAMLEQAQAILEGAAYSDQAAFENTCYEVAVATKATASVIGFGASVLATGGVAAGGATVAGIIDAGGVAFNGVSAILDTATAITICATAGEGNEYTTAFEKTSEMVAPVAAVFSIGGGIQNYKNFRDPTKAEDAVDNAAQAFLVGVGLARDYIQDGTVMGVSTNIANGYREIIVNSAKTSDAQACKEVLKEAGVSQDAIDGKQDDGATDDVEQQVAAAYIEDFGFLADPSNPYDVDTFVSNVDKKFQECAAAESSSSNTNAGASNGASNGSSGDASTLPASEVAGTYEFGTMGTDIFTVQDSSHLIVTDSEGASQVGSYDEKTGVWFVQEEGELDGEPLTITVKVTFSRSGGGIQGDMVFTAGDQAWSFSAMKQ